MSVSYLSKDIPKQHYLNGLLHRTGGPAVEHGDGTNEWYQHGKRHRADGPAVIGSNGYKAWYHNGEFHREDGHAIEHPDGTKEWLQYGSYHRDNEPAFISATGTKKWYHHGKLHREDGPAVQFWDGTEEWWLNGERFDLGGFTLKTANFLQEELNSLDTEQLKKVAHTVGKILQLRQRLEASPPNKSSSPSDTRFKKFL